MAAAWCTLITAMIAIAISVALPELAPGIFGGFLGGIGAAVVGSVVSHGLGSPSARRTASASMLSRSPRSARARLVNSATSFVPWERFHSDYNKYISTAC